MLSPVPTSLVPLAAFTVAPEDAPQVCTQRKKKPPLSGTVQSAAPAPTSGASGANPSSGSKSTKGTKSTKTTKTTKSGSASRTTSAHASASGYARSASSAKSSSSSKKAGPLAFLDDTKLSMEEKLLKLLSYLNDKWNKDLDKKMKEFKQTSTSTSSSGGGSGVGSLVKKAVGFASSAVPQLGVTLAALRDPTVRTVLRNVAGPALAAAATAAGQPQLAPVALQYGPELVDAAAGAASYASSGTAGTSGASSRTTTKETADGIGSDRNAQLKLMEMQRILDQQKEMFSLVSNLLRTTHDTRMAVIQNVR